MLLVPLALMAALVPAAAASSDAKPTDNSASCPPTMSYYAQQRGKSLTPRKLTELPPATGYMAVYRTIGGCNAPLTVVEYRRAPRR
jgi:hypothetical protein